MKKMQKKKEVSKAGPSRNGRKSQRLPSHKLILTPPPY